MSVFRKNRLTDDQLRELLQSLPQVNAPEDFDTRLDQMIALHGEHVPHMLGSLPMVPAPADFDARLMEAIHDNNRRVAPLPIPIAGASVNWLNHIMGWLGGSLAVVALAFFINQPSSDVEAPAPAVVQSHTEATAMPHQGAGSLPTQAERAAGRSGGSVGIQPYRVTISQATTLASAANAVGPTAVETQAPIALAAEEPAYDLTVTEIATARTTTSPAAQMPAAAQQQSRQMGTSTVPATTASTNILSPEAPMLQNSSIIGRSLSAPIDTEQHRDPAVHQTSDAQPAHQSSGTTGTAAETDTTAGSAPAEFLVGTGGDREKKDGFKSKNP